MELRTRRIAVLVDTTVLSNFAHVRRRPAHGGRRLSRVCGRARRSGEGARGAGARGRTAGTAYTPGDFTYADLAAADLANLLAELDEA